VAIFVAVVRYLIESKVETDKQLQTYFSRLSRFFSWKWS